MKDTNGSTIFKVSVRSALAIYIVVVGFGTLCWLTAVDKVDVTIMVGILGSIIGFLYGTTVKTEPKKDETPPTPPADPPAS